MTVYRGPEKLNGLVIVEPRISSLDIVTRVVKVLGVGQRSLTGGL